MGLSTGTNNYAHVDGKLIRDVDPTGLSSATIGLFAGIGAQITFGQNPNGSGFASFQFGYGIGGGISYNPLGQQPGYNPNQNASWGLGYGVYAQGSLRAGPVSTSIGANLGRSKTACGNDLYGGLSKSATAKDKISGISASISGGGQITIFGGGSAQGDCTRGN